MAWIHSLILLKVKVKDHGFLSFLILPRNKLFFLLYDSYHIGFSFKIFIRWYVNPHLVKFNYIHFYKENICVRQTQNTLIIQIMFCKCFCFLQLINYDLKLNFVVQKFASWFLKLFMNYFCKANIFFYFFIICINYLHSVIH